MRLRGGRVPYVPGRRGILEDRQDQLIDEVIRDWGQTMLRDMRERVGDLRQSMEDDDTPQYSISRNPAGAVEIATIHWDPMVGKYGKVGVIEFSENSSRVFRTMCAHLRAKNS